ncbi:hypothetical protein ACROYT_G043491 [Oculina patagonica]
MAEPFENTNSQSSQLDEEELQRIEEESMPENTKKQTAWGMKKFNQWRDKRQIEVDLHSVSATEFSGILRKFYAEVKTNKKKDLTPSALTGIRAAIHRTITSQPFSRPINILKDREFLQANKMFEAVCKSYYKRGNPKPKHKSPIEAGDMEKLKSYFSTECPEKLQEFVWFNLCYYLGRRGREGWRELTKNSLEFKEDDQGKEYVTIRHTEQSKNYQGGNKQKDQDYTDVRMYGIPGSPMDPVASLKLMLAKLHPECVALFQTPLINFDKSGTCWYKNEPLGKNSLSQLMPKISKKAGLSQIYTAHCVRASTITSLHQAGVDAKQICAITKHKNEQSLTPYIKDSSSSQKRACSGILSRPFTTCTSEVVGAEDGSSQSSSMHGGEVNQGPFSTGRGRMGRRSLRWDNAFL